ncbi:3-oxoadipate--succinyl-CoA transferase [Streptomyces californicus]
MAPGIEVVYESGVCGAHPSRLPETIADAVLITGAEAVRRCPPCSGRCSRRPIDVGFLGAAQIDLVGQPQHLGHRGVERPAVRLPGPGVRSR